MPKETPLEKRVQSLEGSVHEIGLGLEEMKNNHLFHIQVAMDQHNRDDKEAHNAIFDQIAKLNEWKWTLVGTFSVFIFIASIVGSALASKFIH